MITGYGIIIENEILYCSNQSKFTSFQIVLFVEKLISSLNPQKTWRLRNIYLKGYRLGKERMLIKHTLTKNNENVFYCITGDFKARSKEAENMMQEFHEKIKSSYSNIELMKQAHKKPRFKQIIEICTDYLWDKYEEILEEEEIDKEIDTSIPNNILYCGISSQGLPIISQLYSRILLENLDKEITEENVELYSSNLSAKLATISMNTVIRAKTQIREIIIDDMENPKETKIVLFGELNNYSLDFFASGDYGLIKKFFRRLKKRISEEPVLKKEFTGDLKPYRHLHDTIQNFYQDGL